MTDLTEQLKADIRKEFEEKHLIKSELGWAWNPWRCTGSDVKRFIDSAVEKCVEKAGEAERVRLTKQILEVIWNNSDPQKAISGIEEKLCR